jgi:BMFP domain-containing protein YqiC
MKNMKEVMDNAADASSKTVKNWMDTAAKAQQNMMSGNAFEKNSELYREWLNNQMNILRPGTEKEESKSSSEKSSGAHQDVFSHWYTQQMENAKKMMDFNREVFNNWMNMGRQNQANGAWSNAMFSSAADNWKSMMNAAFDNMANMMANGTSKDAFSNMFFTGNLMNTMQDFYRPAFDAMQKGAFDMNAWQKFFSADQYKSMVENMFSNFFPQQSVKEMFERYIQMVHQNFSSSQDMHAQSWNAWKTAMSGFPEFMSADSSKFLDMYNQWADHYTRAMSPLMKLMTPGKEKEQMEHVISVLDKMAVLSIKQSQLQYLVYTAGGKALEHSMKLVAEKFNTEKQPVEFQKFFSEWTAVNEKVFTELFASDEYSGLKAEVLSLGMTVKQDMQKQFEQNFSAVPVVYRSEADEMHKTLHDLKKKVRDLEARLAELSAAGIELDEETDSRQTKSKKSSR